MVEAGLASDAAAAKSTAMAVEAVIRMLIRHSTRVGEGMPKRWRLNTEH
jgi:hypothetical protein